MAQPVIQLEYLASREGGMGALQLSCVSGCSCDPSVFDAHHSVAPGSGSRHLLGCVAVSESSACVVRLSVVPRGEAFAAVGSTVGSEGGGSGGGGGGGGSKFVLHALRVLVEPRQPTTTTTATSARGRARKPQGGSTCSSALPRHTHRYMEGNDMGSRGKRAL